MASASLTAQPLGQQGAFNWIYLVDFIVDGILCLFFLFYFNRLFATLVSYAIRLYTWHKFRIYIDIEALQISPLAGRIFFKGIRYHGDNETIFVHGGYITWRYWLVNVRECQIFGEQSQDAERSSVPSSLPSEDGQQRPSESDGQKDRLKEAKSLPCRISVKVSGVEAFLYNRSPAYDAVVESLQRGNTSDETSRKQAQDTHCTEKYGFNEPDLRQTDLSSSSDEAVDSPQQSTNHHESKEGESMQNAGRRHPPQNGQNDTDLGSENGMRSPSKAASPPAFLGLLPIYVECNKGAAVLGNENTQSIITAKFESASGTFDAAKAGPLDLFKILIDFDIIHPYIQMKPNVDYQSPQLSEGENLTAQGFGLDVHNGDIGNSRDNKAGLFNFRVLKRKWWPSSLNKVSIWPSRSSDSVAVGQIQSKRNQHNPLSQAGQTGQSRWLGLTRYLEDDQHDEHHEWETVEYAKSSVLADVNSVGLKFYWEIPGTVPTRMVNSSIGTPDIHADINGASPPEYGIDLAVRGGQVNYGPWADRHRVTLQQIFFPAPFADAIPAKALVPGEYRISTVFTLCLKIEGDTTLRLPFREASKDSRWKGRAAGVTGKGRGKQEKGKSKGRQRRHSFKNSKREGAAPGTDVRPFAWFDVTVSSGSAINYTMDMVAGKTGYVNKLHADVSALNIFSSLNHGLLWRSGKVAMDCDLSNPLAWNALREWLFDISISSLELFLLRDHTFLMVDLIEDWSAGPLADFFTFVPFQYLLKVHFRNFKLFLNTNDANIINNSEDLEDNEFVILYGGALDAELAIPLERFRPASKDIKFDVEALDLGFELCMPSKNTLSALLGNKDVAQLRSVVLHGTYTACSEVRPGLTDTLNLDIVGTSFTISFFGFLARHLAKIKENYFGDNVHFRTLDEYQELVQRDFAGANDIQPSLKGNDLDVILDISAVDVNILLPANLYEAEEHLRIRVDTADVDLRVSSYYLELMVNSTPLEISFTSRSSKAGASVLENSSTQLFLDGVKVFGHRLFGLAPSEPAYVSNWDIEAGKIIGECSTGFLEKCIAAGQSLALTISDEENAVPLPHSLALHDSTFVRFNCAMIHVWCHIGAEALLISTQMIEGGFNDWASEKFSQRLTMTIPQLTLACIDGQAASRHRIELMRAVQTYAYMNTSISFNMVQRNLHSKEQRILQQEHIRTHDSKTLRAQFLLSQKPATNSPPGRQRSDGEVSLPLPPLPEPLADSDTDTIDTCLRTRESRWNTREADRIQEPSFGRPANPLNTGLAAPQRNVSARIHSGQGDFAGEQVPSLVPVAFPSAFKPPTFPFDGLELDLIDVPLLQSSPCCAFETSEGANDSVNYDVLDDDAVHTSFIINAEPGVTLYCKPEAVRIVANILQCVQPKQPMSMLDQYQSKTVSEVLARYALKKGNNSIVDLSTCVPRMHIRFVNTFPIDESVDDEVRSDKYNVIANQLAVTARFKLVPSRQDEADSNSAHVTLGYLAVSAQEGANNLEEDDAALQLVIDDILLWVVDKDRTSIHASFRKTEIAMASRKVEYLAKLIHRTTMLADDFTTDFARILAQPEKRLRYLVYQIMTLGDEIQDPAFLTRPSYVIRSSSDHIRNSDSWKIISRLRYIYQCLSSDEKAMLTAACMQNNVQCPHDSESFVMTKLDQWRSWDALLVRESFAMRILYGSTAEAEQMHDRSNIPVDLALRAGRLRLFIDPGQTQNEFGLDELAIRMSITPPAPPSGLELFREYDDSKITVLQVKNSKLSLHLNWKVCSLVDHILTLFEQRAPGQHDVGDEASHQTTESSPVGVEKFHIVYASDAAMISLDTIHLSQVIACDSIKVSVTGQGWNEEDDDVAVNAIVSAETLSMQMFGLNRMLWHSSIKSPSLCIAYDTRTSEEKIYEALKIAGDSAELIFQMKDEVLGLIEVANSVLGAEAVYLYRLSKDHGRLASPSSQLNKSVRERMPLNVNLALFLNVYKIDVAILNDLTHSSVGRVARVSISPDETMNSTYQIDFDLKAQSHRLLGKGADKIQTVSQLNMPPVNGTVRLLHTDALVTASAMITVEKIVFDGTAVYGLISTLGTARVASAIEAVKADIVTIRQDLAEHFPGSRATKAVKPSEIQRPVVFDGNLTLAGFSISADAPTAADGSGRANFLFELHSVHVRAANRSSNEDAPLPFPEIRVALKQVGVELRDFEHDDYRTCGRAMMGALMTGTIDQEQPDVVRRNFHLSISGPIVELFAETAPTAAQVLSYLQKRLKDIDLSMHKKYLKGRLKKAHKAIDDIKAATNEDTEDQNASNMVSSFAFDLQDMRLSYIIRDSVSSPVSHDREDLVLSLKAMNLLARSEAEARLSLEDLQLALVSNSEMPEARARNSALLPEVVFNVAHQTTKTERRLAFHAAGKALDLQLDPQFILPASDLERSFTISSNKLRAAAADLDVAPTTSGGFPTQKLFGDRKLSSLLISAEFAGAVVRLQGRNKEDLHKPSIIALHLDRIPQHGRYGQFTNEDAATNATLRAPGIAFKVQFEDRRSEEASLNVEVRIDASNNVLYPAVVPLILQISDSVKQVVRDPEPEGKLAEAQEKSTQRFMEQEGIVGADPRAILGKTRLNVGLRICKQEFSLSCQPIAKVAAYAKLEDTYITINTVDSKENGNFFAASAAFTGLNASLRHVYSREPTFSFDIESIVLSLMNSKHLSGVSGISAILNINPSKAQVNAKQLQDILLFREIWMPTEIRHANGPTVATSIATTEPQDYFVQRYKQIAATTAFPWNATVAIAELALDLDLGQAIGKMSFRISKLWASSKKTENSQQNLCVGISEVSMNSSGRMSGFIELQKVKVRTAIAWPSSGEVEERTPLIQGSVGFGRLLVKAAFDYQAFATADITSFEFIVYNVRERVGRSGDRLVAILDGDKVNVYCTASSAALGFSLFQAFEKLIQEKEASYDEALRDVEKFLRRRPSIAPRRTAPKVHSPLHLGEQDAQALPLSLHTDVVVTLRSLDVGAYPSTLLDHQILKAEAYNIQARFAATLEDDKIHSALGLTLGQVRAALATVPHPSIPKKLGEITVEDVVNNASAARGGIILRVPKVVATMQTWQADDSNVIDYTFKSSFEGKIDVGWNYSRISFIRGMWATHTRTLASRLGKPLPESKVKIHGVEQPPRDESDGAETKPGKPTEQQKITAVVNLPQSRYNYRALEPPIIVAPQLRDMGEATPPLEWIGLHRDRLPNVTHQIVIVALLEIAKEVEDAYSRVLGSA